jgi:hypothetical protein
MLRGSGSNRSGELLRMMDEMRVALEPNPALGSAMETDHSAGADRAPAKEKKPCPSIYMTK